MRLRSRRESSSLTLAFALALALWTSPADAAPLIEHSDLPVTQGKVNHAPAILETERGFLACWYSGTTEAGTDSRIVCSRSHDDGRGWSPPDAVVTAGEYAEGATGPNKSVGNVTLTMDPGGRLWMIYATIRAHRLAGIGNLCMGWRCGRIEAKISGDDGETWSPAFAFGATDGALVRSKPLQLNETLAVVPIYLETDRLSLIITTDLKGSQPGALKMNPPDELPAPSFIQPSLIVWQGTVRAYFRDTNRNLVWTALYDPDTGAWSELTATNLPNPGAAVDAFTDDTGATVLIYNPSRQDRHTLRIAASDDGLRFRPGCNLASGGVGDDVAYPYVIRAGDGTWHVVYSSESKHQITHVRFDAEWLRLCLTDPP